MFESWPLFALFGSDLEQSFPDLEQSFPDPGWSNQRIPIVGCSDLNSRWCIQVVRPVFEISLRVKQLLAGTTPFGAKAH